MLNESFGYEDGQLCCYTVPVQDIIEQVRTPTYIYSLKRVLANFEQIKTAFTKLDAHIHYSAKANGNLKLLGALVNAGAGVDAVSGGEIYRAIVAGIKPEKIVFAGVGKTPEDLRYAVVRKVGWFNVENVGELQHLNTLAKEGGHPPVKVALRLNPGVEADTHKHIATGHGGAKFGLSANTIMEILRKQADYPHLAFAGIHLHIGSQLGNVDATKQAVEKALALITPYSKIRTVNIGGGFPVSYKKGDKKPSIADFATLLAPLLEGYKVLLEPGRAIVADAGILVTRVLYVKKQSGKTFAIVDAGMTDLMRPALYDAHHEIIAVKRPEKAETKTQVVGPVCETTDILGKDVLLPDVQPGDLLAILTSGAYGMVMASNYNARPRPAEVVIEEDGATWEVARPRESWEDMIRGEQF